MRMRLLLVGGAVMGLLVVSGLLEVVLTAHGGGKVAGTAEPAMPGSIMGATPLTHVKTPLAQLLPSPTDFPPAYDATVPPGSGVAEAAGDIVGVGVGSTVDPAGCAPAAQRFGPDQTALIVGTDDATNATITVELYRVDTPLTTRRDQITRCPDATVTTFGARADLSTRLQPPPSSVDADDVLAVDQTLQSHGAGQNQQRNLTTLLAQIGDVRVQATAMSFGGPSPNIIGGGDSDDPSSALNSLFTATVARVRHG